MTTNRPLRVFLCHSSADKPAVRELYQKLRAEPWIQPWLDEEELFPGMDWNMEIEKAIEATDVILVCLSNNSITKEGYVQREIRIALDYADYKPEGTLFIIPVRLEECVPPKRLARWQYADYFEGQRERGLQRILISLRRRADSLGLKIEVEETPEVEKRKNPFYSAELVSATSEIKTPSIPQYIQSLVEKNTSQPEFLPHPTSEWIKADKLTLSNGMEFMRVPAGKFLMGSKNNNKLAYDDEKIQHAVDIPYDYWMARFPVTCEQFSQFKKKDFDKGKESHPIVRANWNDAMEYCQWLNNLLKAELPSGLILRLPTEAEWEKAARGTDGYEYPWGNQFDQNKCNTEEGGKGGTTPVGLYSPQGDSPYGCADMTGNVWEWTHSLMKAYPYKIKDGREDEIVSGARVLRGGSFDSDDRNARCAYRSDNDSFDFIGHFGFRVVVSPLFSLERF